MNSVKQLREALSATTQTQFNRATIISMAQSQNIPMPDTYKFINSLNRVKRGVYTLDSTKPIIKVVKTEPTPVHESKQVEPLNETTVLLAAKAVNRSMMNDDVFIPQKDSLFISWGDFTTIKEIIKSGMFFPTYISGHSGNGKTFMVEQACAQLKREYIRVQISPETDEDDLIGGFRLVNGETVFQKGPVIKAMEHGAILLADEVDRSTNKIMCLQGILEGKPFLIKKTGEIIEPKPGFNVIATANSKGRGSDDGRYTAATIIDDAFLERFVATIEQLQPTRVIEEKIILRHMEKYDCIDTSLAQKLAVWSEIIHKTYEAEGVDEIISTRRLGHIVKTYSIFKDINTAISLCISRFEPDTAVAFRDLFSKISPEPATNTTVAAGIQPITQSNIPSEPPF